MDLSREKCGFGGLVSVSEVGSFEPFDFGFHFQLLNDFVRIDLGQLIRLIKTADGSSEPRFVWFGMTMRGMPKHSFSIRFGLSFSVLREST